MDPLQWMGAVRIRVQTAEKNLPIIHKVLIRLQSNQNAYFGASFRCHAWAIGWNICPLFLRKGWKKNYHRHRKWKIISWLRKCTWTKFGKLYSGRTYPLDKGRWLPWAPKHAFHIYLVQVYILYYSVVFVCIFCCTYLSFILCNIMQLFSAHRAIFSAISDWLFVLLLLFII